MPSWWTRTLCIEFVWICVWARAGGGAGGGGGVVVGGRLGGLGIDPCSSSDFGAIFSFLE